MQIVPRLNQGARMKRKVRVKIVEITRENAITTPRAIAVYCSQCEDNAEIVTRTEASAILQTSDPDLEGLIFSGTVHAIKTVNGTVWICKKSLFEGGENTSRGEIES